MIKTKNCPSFEHINDEFFLLKNVDGTTQTGTDHQLESLIQKTTKSTNKCPLLKSKYCDMDALRFINSTLPTSDGVWISIFTEKYHDCITNKFD